MTQFARVIAAIDVANAGDPRIEHGQPAAVLYGRRMSDDLTTRHPDASELLRIAVRGQHVERWTSPRSGYPEGRQGYLDWRRDLAAFHAVRVGEIMAGQGYDAGAIARVGAMLRKEAIKSDPETQILEDTACFVFLRWYFADFAAGRPAEAVTRIAAKTARKMSPAARAEVCATFGLPPPLAAVFRI